MAMNSKTKPAKLSKSEQTRRKMMWYLFIFLGTMLFILSISTAFKTSTTAPREAPRSVVQIEDDAPATRQLSTGAQYQRGQALIGSSQAAERRQGMEIMMAADPVAGHPYIFERLGDPDPGIRAFAATMLATYRIPDADVPLVGLLTDPDPGVRQAVADALLSYLDQAPRILRGLNAALNPRDAASFGPALAVWRATAPHDKPNGLQMIRTSFASPDEAILSQALAAISAVYTSAELGPIRSDLEQIANRFAGRPPGITASSMLNPG